MNLVLQKRGDEIAVSKEAPVELESLSDAIEAVIQAKAVGATDYAESE